MKFRAMSLALLSTVASTVVGAQSPIGGLDGGRQTGLDSWTRQVVFLDDRTYVETDANDAVLAATFFFVGAAILTTGLPDALYNGFGTPSLWNGKQEQADGPSMTLQFSQPVRGVAFNALATQFEDFISPPVFEAALRSDDDTRQVLASFSGQPMAPPAFGDTNLDWWGFEDGLFNELRIYAPFVRNEGFGIEPWVQNQFTYFSLGINNIRILDDPPHPVVVPEPGSIALLTAGFAGLAYVRHRRKKRTSPSA